MLKAATKIVIETEDTLRDLGSDVTAKEWDALAFVAVQRSIRPSELLRNTALTKRPQTLSSVIDRLEKRGLVVREQHPSDSRGVLVTITDEGAKVAEEVFPFLARNVIAPFASRFSEGQLGTITELLEP